MAALTLVRHTPTSTDLVLHAGGGSRGAAVLVALSLAGPALVVPLALAVPTLLVAFWMALAGAQASTVLVVAALVVGAEYVLGWPLLVAAQARDVRRVEFTPADAPTSLRLVRAGRPDEWLPIAVLERVLLTHTVLDPYPGDRKPAAASLTVELVLPGGREKLTQRSAAGDPQRLVAGLEALLAPAGVPVELVTDRSVRAKPLRGSGWTSGGSASAGSAGG